MSNEQIGQTAGPSKRQFAAKYGHRGWGIALAVVGGLTFLGGFSAFGRTASTTTTVNPIAAFVVGIALVIWAVYLLRGRGVSPAAVRRKAASEERRVMAVERQAAAASESMGTATAALVAAVSGGAALVAYRNLWETAKRWHPTDASTEVANALALSGAKTEGFESPLIGAVAAIGGGLVEFYRDWIIFGQQAHDVDRSTRGQVFIDGSVQVTSATVLDKKGKSRIVNTQHDMRTAQLQLSSSSWSMGVPIDPNQANDARRLVDQLASHVDTLKPQQATAADIRTMVDTILANSGQPAAEKLQQLSNLRFERLLTDEEFESAKTRILGIQ